LRIAEGLGATVCQKDSDRICFPLPRQTRCLPCYWEQDSRVLFPALLLISCITVGHYNCFFFF